MNDWGTILLSVIFNSVKLVIWFTYRKHKDGTDFYLGEVVWRDPGTGVNEYAQVFGNLDVLRVACEPMVNNMNGDGTFSITPFHFYQLATISTIAYGHVSFIEINFSHKYSGFTIFFIQVICSRLFFDDPEEKRALHSRY